MNRTPTKGRGALSNPANRFESTHREAADDGWSGADAADSPPVELIRDASRTIITRNRSPDVPFDQSINPYRGCEHGCIYCYARPSHAYWGHSPGLDFETKLHYKPDAAALLGKELAQPRYRCSPLALGANTDAWQPIERRLGITRGILEVLAAARHPVCMITKSALIERDIDLLAAMAEQGLARVMISLTTLDSGLARRLEPRATAPQRRLESIRRLRDAGIPVGVLIAPLIPFLNDQALETLLDQAQSAGATSARYILLRLPLELEELFADWLQVHYPDRAERILNRLRDSRGGKLNDSRYSARMSGRGPFADLMAKRFDLASRRLNFRDPTPLDCSRFTSPRSAPRQLDLFD